MALFSISGNVGGASGSGATVQLLSDRADISQTVICDASGNFTFSNFPDQRTYNLISTPTGANVCRKAYSVSLNGANVTGVNFQISALNSLNNNPAAGGF
jgi:hypothetical protein